MNHSSSPMYILRDWQEEDDEEEEGKEKGKKEKEEEWEEKHILFALYSDLQQHQS